jgi:hypothetical protein
VNFVHPRFRLLHAVGEANGRRRADGDPLDCRSHTPVARDSRGLPDHLLDERARLLKHAPISSSTSSADPTPRTFIESSSE